MSRREKSWSLPLAVVVAAAVSASDARAQTTVPATRPAETAPAEREKPDEDFFAAQREQRDAARGRFGGMPEVGPFSRETVLRLTATGGLLLAETKLPATPSPARAIVDGSGATWVVVLPRPDLGGPAAATFSVRWFDPGVKSDDEAWSVTLTSNGPFLTITAESIAGQVVYNQNAATAALSVRAWVAGPRLEDVVTARGTSVYQLRAEQPEAFARRLLPVLSKLAGTDWLRPGAGDVYTIFDHLPVDPEASAAVAALLPALDSPQARARNDASRRLEALGPPAVLAAVRLDPDALSPEQRARVAAFVERNRRRKPVDPATGRRDVGFLADALEYDDPAVRAAARDALAAVLGRPVDFDPLLTGDALSAAVEAVRREVAPLARADRSR